MCVCVVQGIKCCHNGDGKVLHCHNTKIIARAQFVITSDAVSCDAGLKAFKMAASSKVHHYTSYHGNHAIHVQITTWRNTGITSPHKNRIYKNFTT